MTPPDKERCQAAPNVLVWSPFSLGPMPQPVRCSNEPQVIVAEVEPGSDGLKGSMSLCPDCLEKFRKHSKGRSQKYEELLLDGGHK